MGCYEKKEMKKLERERDIDRERKNKNTKTNINFTIKVLQINVAKSTLSMICYISPT